MTRDRPQRPHRPGRMAAVLALGTVGMLLATAPQIGLTWDEPAYIAASESYVTWLGQLLTEPVRALSASGIEYGWEVNHEHPPADKVWSGLIWAATRWALDDLTAHRLGNILLAGLLAALLHLMVAERYGRIAGIAAVASLLTMPRFFFHAHLAALDVPAATAMLAVIFLFWKTRDRRGLRWGVILGVAWGVALATKINAAFVPLILLVWVAIFERRRELALRIGMMGIVGVPLSVLSWPWFYHDTLERLRWYLGFVTVDHWVIPQWYLGRLHSPPPWHFPLVMVVAVTPLTLLLLAGLGLLEVARHQRTESLGWLLVLAGAVPVIVMALGAASLYDNDRLLIPSFPFLAALCGVGYAVLARGVTRLSRRRPRPERTLAMHAALAAAVFLPQVVHAGVMYPHLLSYYSESVGGLAGARRLGLETTYWCETYARALPFLNARAPRGSTVSVEVFSHDVMHYYQLTGKLRRDLRISWPPDGHSVFGRRGMSGPAIAPEQADFVVVQRHESGLPHRMRRWIAAREPQFVVRRQGIPLLEVYRGEGLP